MFPVLRNQRRTIIFYGFVSIIYDRLNPHIYTDGMRKMLIREIEGERILRSYLPFIPDPALPFF
jgi:hypothetical protein